MINFVQEGEVLDLDPGATVASGVGHLFGTALFGVAAVPGVSVWPTLPAGIRCATTSFVPLAGTSAQRRA